MSQTSIATVFRTASRQSEPEQAGIGIVDRVAEVVGAAVDAVVAAVADRAAEVVAADRAAVEGLAGRGGRGFQLLALSS